MTLLEVINNIHDSDETATIYAKAPWRPGSIAVLAREPESGGTPEEAETLGLDYLLEVSVAQEFLEDWVSSLQSLPTPEEQCDRIIQYAMDDA